MHQEVRQKDINFIIEQVAKSTGWSEDIVSKVLRNEWRIVKSALSTGRYKDMFLKNLGTFSAKTSTYAIDKHIWELIALYTKSKGIYAESVVWDETKKNRYNWVVLNNNPQQLRNEIYNFLQIRRKIKQVKQLKTNRKNMSMILIPIEKLEGYTIDNPPSIDYKDYIGRVATRVKRMRSDHYEKFPEHLDTLESDLANAFDRSVLKSIHERDEEPIDTGLVLIYSEMFKKDDCLQTEMFVRV